MTKGWKLFVTVGAFGVWCIFYAIMVICMLMATATSPKSTAYAGSTVVIHQLDRTHSSTLNSNSTVTLYEVNGKLFLVTGAGYILEVR